VKDEVTKPHKPPNLVPLVAGLNPIFVLNHPDQTGDDQPLDFGSPFADL
jgi:hypothetical protein